MAYCNNLRAVLKRFQLVDLLTNLFQRYKRHSALWFEAVWCQNQLYSFTLSTASLVDEKKESESEEEESEEAEKLIFVLRERFGIQRREGISRLVFYFKLSKSYRKVRKSGFWSSTFYAKWVFRVNTIYENVWRPCFFAPNPTYEVLAYFMIIRFR